MSSNVGLSTPRGSGTSGYVQRNLSHFRPRDPPSSYHPDSPDSKPRHQQRQPDQQILNHDRLREIEVKVFELQDKLEDDGISESEIETQTSALRAKLTAASTSSTTTSTGGRAPLKPHQVHELAAAKIEESENFRRALGIRGDYEEGSHWNKQREGQREGERNGDAGGEEGRGGREKDYKERERQRERRW